MLPALGDAGVAEASCQSLPAAFLPARGVRAFGQLIPALSQELRNRRCLVLQLPLDPSSSCIADM